MNPRVFSIRVNNDLSPRRFAEVAKVAETAGFDQVWLSNDLLIHSALAALPIAVMATRRIRLGIGVLNPYTIHPAEMAMYFASLGEVAAGRLMLGVGAGADDFLRWVGVERARPLREVEAALGQLRYLLGGSAPSPRGWDPAAPALPGSGPIPLYLGAMSPRMLRLAGRVADGALPLLFPPERYHEARALVLSGAKAAGRNEVDLDIAACVWCSVSDDPDDAEAALAEKIAYYGPSFSAEVLGGVGLTADDLRPARDAVIAGRPRDVKRLVPSAAMSLGIAGRPATIVDRCIGLIEAGASHISFGPPLGPDLRIAIEMIGDRVIPELRR